MGFNIMKVEINKHIVDIAPEITTLSELLEHENLAGPGQAVAVDNRLAPRSQWPEIPLNDGMKITVIRAVCGG